MKKHYCNYYAYSDKYKKRMLFSWLVKDYETAKLCLIRMKQTKGFYVVKNEQGKVTHQTKFDLVKIGGLWRNLGKFNEK